MKEIILATSIIAVLFCCKKRDEENLSACFEVLDQQVLRGENVYFNNCSVDASNFNWNFDDGESDIIKEPTHIFSNFGEHKVKLTVFDDLHNEESFEQIIDVDFLSIKSLQITDNYEGFHPFFSIKNVENLDQVNAFDNSKIVYTASMPIDNGEIEFNYREYPNNDCTGAPEAISKIINLYDYYNQVDEEIKINLDEYGIEIIIGVELN